MAESKIKNCVVQCRASTTKQSQEGETLEDQERSIRAFIETRGWKIVPNSKVWSTPISGRKLDRSDFEEILDYIKSHPGQVDHYIFKSIDRFTRAGSGEYEKMRDRLADHGVEMMDVTGIIQPSRNSLEEYGFSYPWSVSRPSEITENVMATVAKQEVNTILTRMIGPQIKMTRQGYRMRRPVDGFVNQKVYVDGKKKPIQVRDHVRAPFFESLFNLRAQGSMSDFDIVNKINAMGYRSVLQNKWNREHNKIIGKSGGIPLTVKQLQRIVRNPAYAGIACEKWTSDKPIRAKSPGIVSIATFNRANKGQMAIVEKSDGSVAFEYGHLHGKSGKQRLRNNPVFPYKFIQCPHCNKSFLGSLSRGKSGRRFPAYHCARGHIRIGIRKSDFDANIERYINGLRFNPNVVEALRITFLNKYREREKEIAKASGQIHENIANLQTEMTAKIEAIVGCNSPVVRKRLEDDVDVLNARIDAAKTERAKIEVTEDDIKSFITEAKKIMEHPAEFLLDQTDIEVQRGLFELVFEKMPTYTEIVNGTPKLSWIFKLSLENTDDENQLVTLRGIEPRLQP